MADSDPTSSVSTYNTLRPGESITIDFGNNTSFTFTATDSLSANTAVTELSSLPPSTLRNAYIEAHAQVGKMTLGELQRELAILRSSHHAAVSWLVTIPLESAVVLLKNEIGNRIRDRGESVGRWNAAYNAIWALGGAVSLQLVRWVLGI